MNIKVNRLPKTDTGQVVQIRSITIRKNHGSKRAEASKTIIRLPVLQGGKKRKCQLSPQQIARRIARGKGVTLEQRKLLREENPALYAKAMIANQIRESLENRLRYAKSDTARAQAVSQAMTQALTISNSEKQAGVSPEENGLPLYMDAIREAIGNCSKPGRRHNDSTDDISDELNKMVEDFLKQYKEGIEWDESDSEQELENLDMDPLKIWLQ